MIRSLLLVLLAGAVVSAEPERILFGRAGIGPGQIGVFLSNADGTGEHALLQPAADDYDPTWSPDGQQLVFVTTRAGGTGDLWILDLPTKRAKPLTSGDGGDFRPSCGKPIYRMPDAERVWGKLVAPYKAALA